MIVAHSSPRPGYSHGPDPAYFTLGLPALTDNYIWLLHDSHGDAVVIDPGEASVVSAALQQHELRLRAILLTHHHPDHIGGVAALRGTGIPVYGADDPRLPASHRVAEDSCIRPDWSGGQFEVLAVPGHTRSHLAFHIGNDLFCGDVLFNLGCGRLFEGSAAQGWSSLLKLAALPAHTRVHCAHEYTLDNLRFAQSVFPEDPELQAFARHVRQLRARGEPTVPALLDEQLRLNPFLRMLDPHWRRQLGQSHLEHDATAAFAELRQRKDQFR